MRASTGDRIIVESTRPGAVRRDGEIVGLHHEDGSPPYDVRWSNNDRITEYFPGPDARIHHYRHQDTYREPAPNALPDNET